MRAKTIFESIGLHPSPNSPCVYSGILPNTSSHIYVGLYVNDFIYFGETDEVETTFRELLKQQVEGLVDFEHEPTLFLGKRITKKIQQDGSFSIHLSQQVIINDLMDSCGLNDFCCIAHTPYCSGLSVDKINEHL